MALSSVPPRLKLTKFAATNYKCLRNVAFDLTSPLAVFVGRNNTGKSTILDVFDFIREAASDPNAAVTKRGTSLASLQWLFLPNAECKIRLEFQIPEHLRESALASLKSKKDTSTVTRLSFEDVQRSPFLHDLSYELIFGPTFSEVLRTNTPASQELTFPLARFGGPQGLNPYTLQLNSLWNFDQTTGEEQYFIHQHAGIDWVRNLPQLLFKQVPQGPAQFAIDWLRDFFGAIYHSSPHRKSEDSQQIQSVSAIQPDGSNLVQVLHTLHNNSKPTFQRIERDIRRLVEGVDSLSTPITINSTTTLIYQTLGESEPVAFPIKQVSAGTIQLLILLTQLHTQPDNGLILLEEMENMLHPRAQAEFARILREMSARLTLLMSTHSPVIAGETREDSLYLIKKPEGATELLVFNERVGDELVEEMGIRSSYSFESNTVVFVEGKFDRRVYEAWLNINNLKSTLIDSGGYSNIQFYANAKILQRRAVWVEKYAVFDGDTVKKGDAKQAMRLLNLSDNDVLKLEADNLECILADANAIVEAFPSLKQSEHDIVRRLTGRAPHDLKGVLDTVLRTVGGYTEDNAATLATKVDPPGEWLTFFKHVDMRERSVLPLQQTP